MITLAQVASEILDNCCSNPADAEDWMENQSDYKGWNSYFIETHCIVWEVIAKKTPDGWLIKSITGESC